MAGIKHAFVSTAPDNPDTDLVSSSEWNAEHVGHDKALHDALGINADTLDGQHAAAFAAAAHAHAGAVVMPSGAMLMWPAAAVPGAPGEWLLCDGAAVSRETYAALFAVIGTTYGAGNGSTTFNVPDLKHRVPIGVDAGTVYASALGQTDGVAEHALTEAEMPTHTHVQTAHDHIIAASTETYNNASTVKIVSGSGPTAGLVGSDGGALGPYLDITGATAVNNNTGGGAAHTNLQPSLALNFIIKT